MKPQKFFQKFWECHMMMMILKIMTLESDSPMEGLYTKKCISIDSNIKISR
ncbi:hypothetical protein RirG_207340 [Rhizophagus irregularis DAOM 197198w]|uniref:Uncharacterized protein n=1 Tax=Rhizophagus irregularis (strain DAOM 197198w) TaxID=1432141 RepID=A0A015KD25_RHIIW|nr:hypothetical protein RirG_207340 [Rhizophagus irregularis DAOM 197198w]